MLDVGEIGADSRLRMRHQLLIKMISFEDLENFEKSICIYEEALISSWAEKENIPPKYVV